MKLLTRLKKVSIQMRILIVLLFSVVFLFFFNLGSVGLIGLDETSYAEITREMIELKDYIVPRFNYEYHFHKPPLLNWMQAFCMHLFGVNELSVRLPSVFAAILALVFTVIIVLKIYCLETAIISSIILGTSVLFIALTRFSVTDMLFSSLTNCSIISFFIAAEWSTMSYRSSTYRWYLTAFILLAFAVLAKGPVALIITFGILIPYLLMRKKLQNMLLNEYFYLSSLVFLIIALPWFVVVHSVTSGEFTRVFFFEHNLTRYTGVISGHDQPIWYFLPVLIIGFLPWTIFLPQTLKYTLKRENFSHDVDQHTFNMFCVFWLGIIFSFFSVANSKLYTYMLPALTPMAILVSVWVKNIILDEKRGSIGFRVSVLTILSLLLFAIYSLKANSSFIQITDIKGVDIHAIALPILILVSIAMAITLICSFFNSTLSFYSFSITVMILVISFVLNIMPVVDKQTELIARHISINLPKPYMLVFYDARKYSMNFYSKRYVTNLKDIKSAQEYIKKNSHVLLVTKKEHKNKFKNMYLINEDNKYAYLSKTYNY